MIDALARSFEWLPVSATLPHKGGWLILARFGASIFASGLLMALPIVTAAHHQHRPRRAPARAAAQPLRDRLPDHADRRLRRAAAGPRPSGAAAPALYDAGFTTLADLLRALR
jgi:flagellar biosynthetic protein FliR